MCSLIVAVVVVVEEWNKLSKHVVSVGTIDTYKKRLHTYIDEENIM